MVALKHFLFVKSLDGNSFMEVLTFKKVKKRVAEAPLVIVMDVYNSYLFLNKL